MVYRHAHLPHAPGGEADDQKQSSQQKPDARLLVFRLRKRFLVGRGIGHGDGGTIDDLDRCPFQFHGLASATSRPSVVMTTSDRRCRALQ